MHSLENRICENLPLPTIPAEVGIYVLDLIVDSHFPANYVLTSWFAGEEPIM